MDNPISSHIVNLIQFISFSGEGAMNFSFIASWLLHLSMMAHLCWRVYMCDLDTLVLCFTLFPSNHREKCLHSLAVAAAS